jgi:hypothetical protein
MELARSLVQRTSENVLDLILVSGSLRQKDRFQSTETGARLTHNVASGKRRGKITSKDEARRIAANIAKLPELPGR